MMTDEWDQVTLEGDIVHVTPADDLIEHEYDEACVCGPEKHCNGKVVFMHWPLDARP